MIYSITRRIYALVMRHLYLQFRDFYRVTDLVYWPVFDLTVWGMVYKSMGGQQALQLIMTNVFLWNIFFRAFIEVAMNILEELVSANLINLMVSPLTWGEWLIALMIMGMLRGVLTIIILSSFIYFFFGINVFAIVGWYLVPLIGLLFLTGWFLGLVGGCFLIFGGFRLQAIVWPLGSFWLPFSSFLFPLSALPSGMQLIGKAFPLHYIFDQTRALYTTGVVDTQLLWLCCAVSVTYFLLAVILFWYSFKRSRIRGLARLQEY